MKLIERLILFQNNAEKNFQKTKTLLTLANYLIAYFTFVLSTVITTITLPLRLLFLKNNRELRVDVVDSSNIDNYLEQELVLLDFWSEWCGPCVMMNSVLNDFSKNSKDIHIGKVNFDTNRQIAKNLHIKNLPQFLLFKKGMEVKRYTGPMTLEELREFTRLI